MVKNGGYTRLDTATILEEKFLRTDSEENENVFSLFDGDTMLTDINGIIRRGPIYLFKDGNYYIMVFHAAGINGPIIAFAGLEQISYVLAYGYEAEGYARREDAGTGN